MKTTNKCSVKSNPSAITQKDFEQLFAKEFFKNCNNYYIIVIDRYPYKDWPFCDGRGKRTYYTINVLAGDLASQKWQGCNKKEMFKQVTKIAKAYQTTKIEYSIHE